MILCLGSLLVLRAEGKALLFTDSIPEELGHRGLQGWFASCRRLAGLVKGSCVPPLRKPDLYLAGLFPLLGPHWGINRLSLCRALRPERCSAAGQHLRY